MGSNYATIDTGGRIAVVPATEGGQPHARAMDAFDLGAAMRTQTSFAGSVGALSDRLDEEPVCWLYGPAGAAGSVVSACPGIRAVLFDPPSAEHSAFAPIRAPLRRLIRQLSEQPCVARQDLLTECGPELAYLLPDVAGLLPSGRALTDQMQMPHLVTRTLPIESELVFRIAAQVGWLLEEGLRLLEVEDSRTPVLFFPRMEHADRPTMVVVNTLCRRAQAGGPKVVLGSIERLDPPPTSRVDTVEGLDTVDAATMRVAEFAAMRDRFGGPEIVLDVPGGCEPLPPGDDREAGAVRRAHTEGSARAWAEAVAVSTTLFNPTVVLDLADVGESVVPKPQLAEATGVALATIGYFELARAQFERGYGVAVDPLDRARLAMYSALVSVKRLAEFADAAEGIARGTAALAEVRADSAELTLERGWLLNLDALLSFRTGDHRKARRCTHEALRLLRPYRNTETIALKTNLVVNTSIIAESLGDPNRALEIWRVFLRIFDQAGESFVHFYHFREAGLLTKAGDPGALSAYERVFTLAEPLGNLPGMLGSTRALVRMNYLSGDFGAAETYALRLLRLCRRHGDVEGLAPAWLAIAACRSALGDVAGVRTALHSAAVVVSTSDLQRESVLRLRAATEIDWISLLPPLPPTMVRYPATWFLPPLPNEQPTEQLRRQLADADR